MISQSRWDDLINIVVGTMLIHNSKLDNPVTNTELDLIASVLKNNTPFQVVPDCCFGNNNQQVGKPNKETIEVMNDDVILETKNFSIIDNGDMNV